MGAYTERWTHGPTGWQMSQQAIAAQHAVHRHLRAATGRTCSTSYGPRRRAACAGWSTHACDAQRAVVSACATTRRSRARQRAGGSQQQQASCDAVQSCERGAAYMYVSGNSCPWSTVHRVGSGRARPSLHARALVGRACGRQEAWSQAEHNESPSQTIASAIFACICHVVSL